MVRRTKGQPLWGSPARRLEGVEYLPAGFPALLAALWTKGGPKRSEDHSEARTTAKRGPQRSEDHFILSTTLRRLRCGCGPADHPSDRPPSGGQQRGTFGVGCSGRVVASASAPPEGPSGNPSLHCGAPALRVIPPPSF